MRSFCNWDICSSSRFQVIIWATRNQRVIQTSKLVVCWEIDEMAYQMQCNSSGKCGVYIAIDSCKSNHCDLWWPYCQKYCHGIIWVNTTWIKIPALVRPQLICNCDGFKQHHQKYIKHKKKILTELMLFLVKKTLMIKTIHRFMKKNLPMSRSVSMIIILWFRMGMQFWYQKMVQF